MGPNGQPTTSIQTTYTGAGNTPAGQQLNTGSNLALTAAANSTVQGGQTLTPDVVQALQTAYTGANALNVQNSTPQARQDVLSGTNLGAAQQNYSDIAQKLAAYDNAVLKPEFAGSDPGMPSEMSRVSGFVQPGLTYASNGGLTPEQVLYNANPTYALTAQANQKNNILDVLGTLNDVIAKELGRGKDIYGSKLKTSAAVLDSLDRILGKNTDLEMKKAELATQLQVANLNRALSPLGIARSVGQELSRVAGPDGYVSPMDYQRVKRLAADSGLSGADYDAQFSSYRNPTNSYYQLNLSPTEQNTVGLYKSSLDLLNDFNKSGYLNAKTGTVEARKTNTLKNITGLSQFADPQLVNFESNIGPIRDTILNAISGANVSAQEAERVKAWLPDTSHSPAVNQANYQSLVNWLNSKYRSAAGTEYSPSISGGNTGSQNVSSAVQKLKTAGYSDAQISSYLKAKGLQ